MLKTRFGIYDGDGWEEHCQVLLKLRYDSDGYQEMPAHTRGDLGIEGFTRTGIVFQCYCPDEEYETTVLYHKQRDKVTADLGKLRKYKQELKRYMKDIKIRQWVFLTPLITNKELLAHCQNKASEYREMVGMSDLLHEEFDILAKDEGFFIPELAIVQKILDEKFHINVTDPHEQEMIDWKKCNSEAVDVLLRKIGVLFEGDPKQSILTNKYVDITIRALVKGRKVTNELNE